MNASNHHHHRHHPRSAMNVDESTGEESFIPSAGATAASTAAPLSANDMQFSSFMRNSVQEAYFLVAIDKIGPHTAQRCMKTVFWSRVVDWLNSIDEQWRKEDRQPLFSDLSPSACIERWRTLSAEGAQYMTFGDTRIVEGRDQKPTPHQDKWRWDMITRLHREELKARELDNTRLSPTPQLSTQAEAPQTSSSDTRQTQEWDASREPQATSRSDDEQHQIPNNSSHLEQFHGTSTQQQQKQQREHDNLLTLQQSKACKEILQHPLQPAIAHSRATPHGPMHPLSQSGGPYQPSQPAGSCPQSSQVSSSYSQASQSSSSYSQESQPEALHPMDLPPGQRSRLNTVMFQPPSPAGLDAIRPVSQRLEPMGKKDIQRVTRRVSTAPQPQEPSAFAEIVPQLSQTPQPSQPPQLSQPPQPPQPSQPTQPTQPTRSNGITLQVAERIEESGPGPGPEAQSKPEPQLAEPGQEAFRDVSVLPPSPSKRSSDVIPSLHQEADETKPQLVIIELSPLPQISSTTIPQIRHSVENPVESGLSDTESYENSSTAVSPGIQSMLIEDCRDVKRIRLDLDLDEPSSGASLHRNAQTPTHTRTQGHIKTQMQVPTRTQKQMEPQTQIRMQKHIEPQTQIRRKRHMETQIGIQARKNSTSQTQTQTLTQTLTQTDVRPQTCIISTQMQIQSNARTQTYATAQTQTSVNAQTQTPNQAQTQTDTLIDMYQEASTLTHAQTEPDTQIQVNVQRNEDPHTWNSQQALQKLQEILSEQLKLQQQQAALLLESEALEQERLALEKARKKAEERRQREMFVMMAKVAQRRS